MQNVMYTYDKNFLLYPTDPINYGEEIVDIKKRIGKIENILNEVLQKVSAKKPELELNLPGPSQPLDASITDEDLESILVASVLHHHHSSLPSFSALHSLDLHRNAVHLFFQDSRYP